MCTSVARVENDYHLYVPATDDPRIRGLDTADPREFSKAAVANPIVQPIFSAWQDNLTVPFYGITNDGKKREDLYQLQDEGAPSQQMVDAASRVLDMLSPAQKLKAHLDLDVEEWRKWANPEIIVFDVGLCLTELQRPQIDAILELLRASLSGAGYAKVRGAIETNKFLGEVCNSRAILNEDSYSMIIFGQPSNNQPWGYTFWGHHLCLNVFIIERQMVIGPIFIGAEPNIIDLGPKSGLELFSKEGQLGLRLMQSLPPELQRQAQIYSHMRDPKMPPGRWNIADQRHLAGATQDNRTIPYEGIPATALTAAQQDLLMQLVEAFQELLPALPLRHRLQQVRSYLHETFFSWIGGFGDEDPFYYRIQSPVILLEFDHHSGVYLTNAEPAKYHIHTIQRLPNGNDYGRELIRLWRAER